MVEDENLQNLRLWEIASQQFIGEPFGEKAHRRQVIVFSPNGQYIAMSIHDIVSTDRAKTIQLWDAATQKALGKPLQGHTDSVESVAFSPDGKLIASGSSDKTVRLWNVATQRARGKPLCGHRSRVMSVAFTSDGRYLASGSTDRTVILWDIAKARWIHALWWNQGIMRIAITRAVSTGHTTANAVDSAKEDIMVIGDEAGTISFWAISRLNAGIRFLGMPRYKTMSLLAVGVNLAGCRMDQQSKRLLEQYNADVSKVKIVDKTVLPLEEKNSKH